MAVRPSALSSHVAVWCDATDRCGWSGDDTTHGFISARRFKRNESCGLVPGGLGAGARETHTEGFGSCKPTSGDCAHRPSRWGRGINKGTAHAALLRRAIMAFTAMLEQRWGRGSEVGW
jgi:hypothetical protein